MQVVCIRKHVFCGEDGNCLFVAWSVLLIGMSASQGQEHWPLHRRILHSSWVLQERTLIHAYVCVEVGGASQNTSCVAYILLTYGADTSRAVKECW
ncbi:hypothetical protein DUNSADRAFT_11280 [Dunaliella salina]|uniref:Secreted protein n=1 Tax=Dunaliella salina TaxID=3046 RepID=A0ABQ7GDQ1_DUNSA|nr:hypothetical protein DUNSADRAFT_11280 [Dunaliella salina]|eukprot:KAF5832730.1 hypothetical protein DUNSADRAFT_11280 [Dunaliella salina]